MWISTFSKFGGAIPFFVDVLGPMYFSSWSSNSSGCKCWFYLALHKDSSTLLLVLGSPLFCTSVPIDDLDRCFSL